MDLSGFFVLMFRRYKIITAEHTFWIFLRTYDVVKPD